MKRKVTRVLRDDRWKREARDRMVAEAPLKKDKKRLHESYLQLMHVYQKERREENSMRRLGRVSHYLQVFVVIMVEVVVVVVVVKVVLTLYISHDDDNDDCKNSPPPTNPPTPPLLLLPPPDGYQVIQWEEDGGLP